MRRLVIFQFRQLLYFLSALSKTFNIPFFFIFESKTKNLPNQRE